MNIRTLTHAVAAPVGAIALVAASLVAFVMACDVGLHLSAKAAPLSVPPAALVSSSVAVSIICGIAAVSIVRWRLRSEAYAPRWIAATVLGLVATVVGSVLAGAAVILLASSTWGNFAGGDFFTRNQLVDATSTSWLPWLALLAAGLGALAVTMLWGLQWKQAPRPRRRYLLYAPPLLVPVACVGALAATASFTLAP